MTVLLPTSLDDALALLADDPSSLVLAGGTDLMVQINEGTRRVDRVVALGAVPELRIREVRDGDLFLGAGVTYTELMDPEVAAYAPALAAAARTVGSPQIRNAGTIGGNLGTASPAGDTLPVLRALGASVEIAARAGAESGSGARRVEPLGDFLTGPKQTALRPGELIVGVRVPLRRGPQEYLKVGVRNAMVIAVASLALVLDLDRLSVGVGLGSVGPVALDAPEASTWLANRLRWLPERAVLDDRRVGDEFAAMVAAAARPIDDHRSGAAYRRHAVEVMARRALRRCTT
jgi:CO/xanthine dehydrogenase FAD-binding subunit